MLNDDGLGDVYCIVDGLDECDKGSRVGLLDKFTSAFPKNGPTRARRFKLMVLSRDTSGLNFSPDHKIEMSFANSASTRADIEHYIDNKLGKLASIVETFDLIRKAVQQILMERADGTFLWIGLAIRQFELSEMESAEDILELLDSMPNGLDSLYNKMLDKISPKTREVMFDTLRWTTVAHRPMTISELTAALEIKDLGRIPAKKRLSDRLRECRNFLQTVPGKHVVYIQPPRRFANHAIPRNPPQKNLHLVFHENNHGLAAQEKVPPSDPNGEIEYVHYRPPCTAKEEFVLLYHQSMRDFFLGNLGQILTNMQHVAFNKEELQLAAGERLLTYLLESVLKDTWTCFNLPGVQMTHPHLHYASMNWLQHAQRSPLEGAALLNSSATFFQNNETASLLRYHWLLLYFLECGDMQFAREYGLAYKDRSLLHIASMSSMFSWIDRLIPTSMEAVQRQTLLNTGSEVYHTPLHCAINGNNLKMVE